MSKDRKDEDFMADREQDVPKDRSQAHSLRQIRFLTLWLMFVYEIRKVAQKANGEHLDNPPRFDILLARISEGV